jgi:hypothetical protein
MTRAATLESLRPATVDRIVYTTITMMSVLIIYDGWQHLRLFDVVGVIVGPVVAMFIAHVFSASIAIQMAADGVPTPRPRMETLKSELPFLLFCVPPLALLLIQYLVGVALTEAIRVTLCFGLLSLGWWGFVVGKRAHLTGWGLAISTAFGLSIGIVVLLLQVFLQPGKLISG